MRQLCASQTLQQPEAVGDNRTPRPLGKPNLAAPPAPSTSLLPVVTPEAPRLPGGAFSVVRQCRDAGRRTTARSGLGQAAGRHRQARPRGAQPTPRRSSTTHPTDGDPGRSRGSARPPPVIARATTGAPRPALQPRFAGNAVVPGDRAGRPQRPLLDQAGPHRDQCPRSATRPASAGARW
jgi:hypothetical protein